MEGDDEKRVTEGWKGVTKGWKGGDRGVGGGTVAAGRKPVALFKDSPMGWDGAGGGGRLGLAAGEVRPDAR